MADDDKPEDDGQPDLGAQRRRQAQGAAADLSRMGIDPRSLGLTDGPPLQSQPEPSADPGLDTTPSAPVVPLRPEFAERQAPPEPPAPPSVPAQNVTANPSAQNPTAQNVAGAPSWSAPGSAPPPPPADRPLSTVEQLLARTATSTPAPRPASLLARTWARGVVTVEAAEAVQGDRELVDAVRHRQSDRRVVAVVSAKGGVGSTTVALGIGTCFVALRDDRSAVVDVGQGTLALSTLVGASAAVDVTAVGGADPDQPLPAAPSGLSVVDAVEWDLSLARRDLAAALDRIGADHTFALLDVGSAAGEGAHAALARADQVVVVTTPGAVGAAALSVALDRARDVNPVAARRALHVVVCPNDELYRSAHREVVQQLGLQPSAVVVVPPDPFLAAGSAYDASRVSSATREAFVRAAAGVSLGTQAR